MPGVPQTASSSALRFSPTTRKPAFSYARCAGGRRRAVNLGHEKRGIVEEVRCRCRGQYFKVPKDGHRIRADTQLRSRRVAALLWRRIEAAVGCGRATSFLRDRWRPQRLPMLLETNGWYHLKNVCVLRGFWTLVAQRGLTPATQQRTVLEPACPHAASGVPPDAG